MDITCISDLHGHYPNLEGGDLLIIAGDLTGNDTFIGYFEFFDWFYEQNYKKKVLIAGNHDQRLQNENYKGPEGVMKGSFDYLCDSGTDFEGLKIWGSPWTKTFEGMNPKCKAFTVDTEEELAVKFSLIPEDTDILITHSPPWGILDKTTHGNHVGSKALAIKLGHMENPPTLWCWGHIHESYGEDIAIRRKSTKMINASHVNERYLPVNKPIRIEF